MNTLARTFLLFLLLVGLTGCGNRMRTIEGQVVFTDGKPLPGGLVTFHPADAGQPAVMARGDIGRDGTFRMGTFAASDGVLEGNYRVTVSPPLPNNPNDLGRVKVIPPKYEDPDKSGLTFRVTGSHTDYKITLHRP